MAEIIEIIIILAITYITGSIIEKNHFKNIQQREISLIKQPMVNFGAKKWTTDKKIKKMEMVAGEVVISGDYFKNFIACITNIFGGRLTSFEAIMDRGRREAILRMREKAKKANIIVNTRIETILINDSYLPQQVPQCAIIAYGTAITYE